MTAEKARKLATDINNTTFSTQYGKAQESIKAAAEKGDLEVTLYSGIHKSVMERLRKDGFEVKVVQTGRNESGIKISW